MMPEPAHLTAPPGYPTWGHKTMLLAHHPNPALPLLVFRPTTPRSPPLRLRRPAHPSPSPTAPARAPGQPKNKTHSNVCSVALVFSASARATPASGPRRLLPRLRAVSGDRGARRQVGQIGGLEGKGGSRCRAYARVAWRAGQGWGHG